MTAADGDPALAEAELRDVWASQTQILGPDHPRTLITVRRLAASIAAQGRSEEAIVLYREAYDKQSGVLGTDHPDTTITANELVALAQV